MHILLKTLTDCQVASANNKKKRKHNLHQPNRPTIYKSLHKQQDKRNQRGREKSWGKGKAEAYGLWLADDVGDGLGGFGEDGGGVHPLQVHVGRHVQARHPRSLPLPLPPLRDCLRLAAFSSALLRSLLSGLCSSSPSLSCYTEEESHLLCLP